MSHHPSAHYRADSDRLLAPKAPKSFKAEARRQSLLVAASEHDAIDQAFVDAISDGAQAEFAPAFLQEDDD